MSMLKYILFIIVAGLSGAVAFVYIHTARHHNNWETHLPTLCSFSSPRAADLNGDGILDIVIGAGNDEFQGADSAVIVFDGESGTVLWHAAGRDQMVGSPVFYSINEDSILDVIISGRAGQLMALSGKDGSKLWSFYSDNDFARYPDSVFLNFYGPQLLPDLDDDGLKDLLVAYGGDATIPRHEPNRPAGKLLIVSSQDGKPLAQATMPDGKETYMTPLCADLDNSGNLTVIFGTGGEIYSGHLYRATLHQLRNNDLSAATLLATGEGRGFIAPPVLADITHDGTLDIIVNAVDGRMLAFDGKNNTLLWEVNIPDAEVYGSLAVGNFNADDTPDFFTNFGRGIFPEVEKSIQLMVNGKTGQVEYQDSLGFLQIGSPLAVDMNSDGIDEALMSINWYDTQMNQNHYYSLYGILNQLRIFHFKGQSEFKLTGILKGANPAATPWIGDLDQDGRMDLVYTYITDTVKYIPFNGMKIVRKELNVPANNISWGSYMGTQTDGIYHTRPAF